MSVTCRPAGNESVAAAGAPPWLEEFETRSGWPSARLAAMPVAKGAWYLSTRLLLLSATHTFPELSTMTALGVSSVLAERPPLLGTLDVRSGWPSAMVAAAPVAGDAGKRTTRLLPASATHRFPDGSKAMPTGSHSVVAETPQPLLVRSGCPSATVAAMPLATGAGYFTTRSF